MSREDRRRQLGPSGEDKGIFYIHFVRFYV